MDSLARLIRMPAHFALAWCLALSVMRAAGVSASEEAFFEGRIRPVLLEHCGECHLGGKSKGGFRMDSRAAILAGGESGAAVVPGDPDASAMIRAVRYADPDFRMPPRHRLEPAVVKDLEQWVRLGLPDPRPTTPPVPSATPATPSTNSNAGHWAFQPLREAAAPAEKSPTAGTIDRFLLQRLRANGLRFNPPADRRTWLRRVTLDLTGLPPTPEEIWAFEADRRPDARERRVEGLLSSPAYGERWARWWLDVARYADTNGQDENKVMANAWRYRDWVVRSFNRDMPFDRFVQQQIAGDLLVPTGAEDAERHDGWIATGFLVLGPKLLAEQDKPKLVLDIIDEQVDTIGRALLGLTFGCARCHDHKFDPVPQREYYAMAGIFRSTRSMQNLDFVSKFNERPLVPPDEVERVAAHAKALREATQQLEKAGAKPAAGKEQQKPSDPAELDRLKAEVARLQAAAPPAVPLALAVDEAQATNLPVMARGSHLNPGRDLVPRGFPSLLSSVAVSSPGADASGRLEFAQWLTHPSNPLTPRVLVNRLWQAHFGEGLVRTPDNFGLRGEPPSHPELLDWLARSFMASGWSLKWLHRQIVLSDAYGQTSDFAMGRGVEVDPENRWLHRYPIQRLEAEMIRDALLAVSGRLDRTLGGSVVSWKNDEYVPGDEEPFGVLRRALYLPVVRDRGHDLFTAFDGANASVSVAHRSSTVVSPQALYLLNAKIVRESAAALGQRILSQPETLRVEQIYRWILGRAPRPTESDRATHLLLDPRLAALKEPERWAVLAQALLCSNEFIHRL
jgi:hypothetical protein